MVQTENCSCIFCIHSIHIAFIEEPQSIRRILPCIGEPTEPPRIHPPRAPPDRSEIDQTITLDEDLNQDRYDYAFDQSVSW